MTSYSNFVTLKDVGKWQFLTIKAAETFCMFAYYQRNILPEKTFGYSTLMIIITSAEESAPSALLFWLKRILHNHNLKKNNY